jgi:thioesterase domain-containing protein
VRAPDVEAYLHRNIPLSAAMGVRVLDGGPDHVVLEAPLHPNVNHHDTAFGGSVTTLAILAGWAHVHLRLEALGFKGHTVIQQSSIDFVAPASASFRATCEGATEAGWNRLSRMLARYGKGRIRVEASVESDGHPVAYFKGAYVALPG